MKLNKIFSLLLGGALLAGVSACTDEVDYVPADPITGSGVYFPEIESTNVAIEQNTSEVSVDLLRTNAESALNVALISTVTDKSGAALENPFIIPTQVSFPAGSKEVAIPISYDFAKVVPETAYYVTIKINGGEKTPYGRVEQQFILKYAPWSDFELYKKSKEPAVGTFSLFGLDEVETPVYVSESLIGAGFKYRFGDYGCLPEAEKEAEVDFVNGGNIYLTVEKDPLPVQGAPNRYYPAHMEPFATGDDQSFGTMLYTTDAYTFRTEIDSSLYPGNTEEELRGVSYYDSVTGMFTIYTIWYFNNEMYTYSFEYFQLPGFKNYGLEFTYTGNFVNTKNQEVAMIEAHRTDDVASFTYELYQGALTEEDAKTAIADLKANTDAELFYEALVNLQFSLKPGDYTIVGVGYDAAGKAVCDATYTFTFKSVQVASDWETVGEVDYRDGIIYGTLVLTDGSYLGGNVYQVELQKHKTEANYYRIVNPCAYYAPTGVILEGDYYLKIRTTSDGKHAILEDSYVGVDLAPIGDTKGQWVMSQAISGFLEKYTPDEIYANFPEYFGEFDTEGILEFPAGMWMRCPETLYVQGRGYKSNYNDALLAALDDPSLSGEEIDANIANHVYGMGLFACDFYDVIYGAPAHRSAAMSNTVPFRKGALQMVDYNVERISTLTMPGKPKNVKKAATIRGTKVDSKELLKNRVKMQLNRIVR